MAVRWGEYWADNLVDMMGESMVDLKVVRSVDY
jgi:hypothetical protein